MTLKSWQDLKLRYCDRAGCEVALQAEMVYPAEHLPEQPPRVFAHRCSHAVNCMLHRKSACLWAGGDPAYDPFLE
ncbi:MAG: hypothetical protein U1B80_07260 [Anaerolineaceae bacterium]|nr:hypothetical protein [Anaerolineaceae bacterium]